MSYYGQWKPYVPVAKRRQRAAQKMAKLRKQGVDIQPVEIEGRKITRTFWGTAWCDHLESFSDYANRLPRGRTYVRNGSVCHLEIDKGRVGAKVSGSDIYNITVRIETLSAKKWKAVKSRCSGQIGSLLELLQGNLSNNIMQAVTDRKDGLFPGPREIKFACDCPDSARMCKHIAAVLYGVGARLDQEPALLFRLRGVNHEELIDVDAAVAVPTGSGTGGAKRLAANDLGDVFGIDLATNDPAESAGRSAGPNGPNADDRSKVSRRTKKSAAEKTKAAKSSTKAVKKKAVKKKAVKKKAIKKKAVKKKAVVKSLKKSAGVPFQRTDLSHSKPPRKTVKKRKAKRLVT